MESVMVGRWALIIGIIVAVLAGLGLTEVPALPSILFVAGLIVGFINIKDRESSQFLIALIALLVIGVAGLQLGKLTILTAAVLKNFISFVSAAGLVVALKQIIVVIK